MENCRIAPSPFGPAPSSRPDLSRMTAMKNVRNGGDSTTDSNINSNRPKSINDRKFAFLNHITRPDYRSLPASVATSQSSVPSTPVSVPGMIRNVVEDALFKEFGAPIATPEDEQIEDLEMKSEPLLSPRRTFDDFVEYTDEKENVENCGKAEQIIVDIENKIEPKSEEEKEELVNCNEEIIEVETTTKEDDTTIIDKIEEESTKREEKEVEEADIRDEIEAKDVEELDVSETIGAENDVEQSERIEDPQVPTSSSEQSLIDEEIRQMTESFGEPRKAVLERVDDTIDHGEEEEEDGAIGISKNQEEKTSTSADFGSNSEKVDNDMVFGWNSKSKTSTSNSSEKAEKPNSLLLCSSSKEPECSDKKRAEFQINIDDDEIDDSQEPLMTSSGDEGLLQQSLLQLQKQLRKSDVRCSRLEKICEFQQKDIDSLRFEMDWKDKRIEYLQKTLQEMETNSNVTNVTTPKDQE